MGCSLKNGRGLREIVSGWLIWLGEVGEKGKTWRSEGGFKNRFANKSALIGNAKPRGFKESGTGVRKQTRDHNNEGSERRSGEVRGSVKGGKLEKDEKGTFLF